MATENSVLPLFYKDQFDSDVYWICDKDDKGKIVSIFLGHGDRYTAYMDTEADVKHQESMLREKGWVKCRKPDIKVNIDETKLPRKLKRQEKRRKEKKRKRKNLEWRELLWLYTKIQM